MIRTAGVLCLVLMAAGCDSGQAESDEMVESMPSLNGRWSAYAGETDSTIAFYELTFSTTVPEILGSARVVRRVITPSVRDDDTLGRHALLPLGDTVYVGLPGNLSGSFESLIVTIAVDHVAHDGSFAGPIAYRGRYTEQYANLGLDRVLEGSIFWGVSSPPTPPVSGTAYVFVFLSDD